MSTNNATSSNVAGLANKSVRTKPKQTRKPPHLTWFITNNPRPYSWLKSSKSPNTMTRPTQTTISLLPPKQTKNQSPNLTPTSSTQTTDIKIEPTEEDSYNYLITNDNNQPETILPDFQQPSVDNNYSIETIQPYKLIIPKTEPNNSSSNSISNQIKVTTQTNTKCAVNSVNSKTTQTLITNLSTNESCKNCERNGNNKRNKSTQCLISRKNLNDNTLQDKSIGIQCKIKAQSIETGVQCAKKMFSVKTNTDSRLFKKNAWTQVNLQRHDTEIEMQASGDNASVLTTICVYMNSVVSRVVGIVEKHYPSLYSSILPNRVEILRRDLMDVPCFGQVPCKLVVESNGTATVVTVLRTVRASFDASCADELKKELFNLSDAGRHVFCPGLDEWYADIAIKSELVEKLKWPYERMQSKKCLEWYMAGSTVPKAVVTSGIATCRHCLQLQRYLKAKKLNPATEEQKRKRLHAGSHCTLRCLSPESLKKRKLAIANKCKRVTRKMASVLKDDVLSNEEYEEVEKIVNAMAAESALQEVMLSDGELLQEFASKEDWAKNELAKFSKLKILVLDQKLNRAQDGKGNRWSEATMKLAIALYKRSPATYHRLRDLKLLKLPCVRHLKRVKSRSVTESSSAVTAAEIQNPDFVTQSSVLPDVDPMKNVEVCMDED